MNAAHPVADRILACARGCVGARFRPQGRAVATGLDCAGLVALAAEAAGAVQPALPVYRLDAEGLSALALRALAAAGLRQVADGSARPGDVVLFELAPGRPHLAILTETGIVHAHAGLRRVVEQPINPDWRVIGHFRFPGAE